MGAQSVIGARSEQARERVSALVDRWIARGLNVYPAKEAPFDPEDAGVPPAMWVDEPGADGWVHWKPLPGAVREEQIARIEARADAALPPLVRAYLECACIGPIESRGVRLPAIWSDAPLRDVEVALEQWSPLERAGFLVIAENQADAGPICLDLRNRRPDGDCPIVLFDPERLAAIGPEACADRRVVGELADRRFDSFASLLDHLERTMGEGSLRPPA